MSTPYTDNPSIRILRSLEEECAIRYQQATQCVDAIATENRVLRLQRDALLSITKQSVDIFGTLKRIAILDGETAKAEVIEQAIEAIQALLKDLE